MMNDDLNDLIAMMSTPPDVGLNADWSCSAYHCGPSPTPNTVDGDVYVIDLETHSPEEGGYAVVRRWYHEDANDTIKQVGPDYPTLREAIELATLLAIADVFEALAIDAGGWPDIYRAQPASLDEIRAGWRAPTPDPDPVPLCEACVGRIGGAVGEPDFPWYAVEVDGAPCGADDHVTATCIGVYRWPQDASPTWVYVESCHGWHEVVYHEYGGPVGGTQVSGHLTHEQACTAGLELVTQNDGTPWETVVARGETGVDAFPCDQCGVSVPSDEYVGYNGAYLCDDCFAAHPDGGLYHVTAHHPSGHEETYVMTGRDLDDGIWRDLDDTDAVVPTTLAIGEEASNGNITISRVPDTRYWRDQCRPRHWFAPPPHTPSKVDLLSDAFSRVMRSWTTPDELRAINARNAEEAHPSICHSHDYFDANEAMVVALDELGIDVNDMDESGHELWGLAWTLSRSRGFAPRS